MSIQETRTEGGWEECIQKQCALMFYRYAFGHKCYTISDRMGVCPLCIFTIKVQNGTLPKREGDVSRFVHHKNNDSRPESGSL